MIFLSLISIIPILDVEAASNPNLFVSAENSQFRNHFSGSMVIEVVIRDNNIRDTDQGKGEPDVTLNGKSLRMVQATDGNWYAYFANIDKAKNADSTVALTGQGLDFGSICTAAQGTSVIGIDLSDTDGVAYPYDSCSGIPNNSNNVVRKAKSPNPVIPEDAAPGSDGFGGQIGIVENTWPFIQLFSFNAVTIQYNPGGPSQQISLEYDEMPNISLKIDRAVYPSNAEVFLTVNDFQLNQDPTDEDSWTFGVASSTSTFYQAFDNSGSSSANGGPGLVNLVPRLSALGFENNGELSLKPGNVMEFRTNSNQPTAVTDGVNTFLVVTLVERQPNSGIFESFDSNDQSVIGILANPPRGQSGQISYNDQSISVLTGSSSASVSVDAEPTLTIGNNNNLRPGIEYPVILKDPDQNLNTGSRDDLDVFRDTAIIPTMTIGDPITLENANSAKFHSSFSTFPIGFDANSSVPDSKSDRLHVNTVTMGNASFEVFSVNLGQTASSLASILLDNFDSDTSGTNWINYDLRSFEKDLGVSDFRDTSFSLYFDSLSDPSPIKIIDSGDISSSQGFIQLDNSDVTDILNKNGNVFLVIDFDSSDNDIGAIDISSETNQQPIVFDLFSFGLKDDQSINNSIYRFELEETGDNSSTFEGTLEYAVTNQLNILDPNFIQTIQTIGDEIKIIITNRLIDESGITISYSDLDVTGVVTTTSTQSDFNTHSGSVVTSQTFRFGQPVTITLKDPDLNLKKDLVDIYFVNNDPNSVNVDTVGKNGVILLEVLIKDIRYKRCTIDGIEYGGLGATGFTLVETGPSTGIFEGVFKMPSKICNKSGTALISSAGGSLDAKYYDARDSSGNANTFNLLRSKSSAPAFSLPQLSSYEIVKPLSGKIEEITLSGSVNNHRRGLPLEVTIISPDGKSQNFASILSNSGGYRSIISINEKSLSGLYKIQLSHNNLDLGLISFEVISPQIPNWFKSNAKAWASTSLSNSEFIDGVKYLIEEGIIAVPSVENISFNPIIPDWIKNNAGWWADGKISDDDFITSLQFLIKEGIIRV